jgi:hypothetical protein
MGATAQDSGYLYGEVHMVNDEVYTGQLRWGKQEAFWHDTFNSTKVDNPFIALLSEEEMKQAGVNKYSSRENNSNWYEWSGLWNSVKSSVSTSHSFACAFGDIAQIKVTGRDAVIITFKNDDKMMLDGGSNDVGEDIIVKDAELGEITLDWDRIDYIVFKETPRKLANKDGDPLYARVKGYRATMEGFVQWDVDEALTTDILDGSSKNGKMKIAFGNIAKIKKMGRGCLVTLKSGREVALYDSNDVDGGNRGIAIKNNSFGNAELNWDFFDEIEFLDTKGSGLGYTEYKLPQQIAGVVTTVDGQTYEGKIAYDIDESLELEFLDGKDQGIEYQIPFRLIKRIEPRNHSFTQVILKDGTDLLLTDTQDVTSRNDGVIVFEKGKKIAYIPWKEVRNIELK